VDSLGVGLVRKARERGPGSNSSLEVGFRRAIAGGHVLDVKRARRRNALW
jgi:hypothetical protein